ncbi:MAG: dehydrogenase, partial [Thermus sp.]|nr:dehydrogenase [Thermus sp.]
AVDPGKVQEVDHFPSLPGGDYPWLPAFSRGITLRSALANIPRYIAEVLALQRVGRLKGRFVFSHRLPLAEAAEGYRLFHERKATKVALVP